MFKNIKIGTKITGIVLAVAILTVAAISYISYDISKSSIEKNYRQNLNVLADIKVNKIESYFNHVQSNIRLTSQSPIVHNPLKKEEEPLITTDIQEDTSLSEDDTFGTGFPQEEDSLGSEETGNALSFGETEADPQDGLMNFDFEPTAEPAMSQNNSSQDIEKATKLLSSINKVYGYYSVFVTDLAGKTIISSTKSDIDKENKEALSILPQVKGSLQFSKVIKTDSSFHTLCGAPILSENGETLGALFYKINLNEVFKILNDTTGLGSTGETLLLAEDKSGKRIIYLNPLRNAPEMELKTVLIDETDEDNPIQQAIKGINGTGNMIDYRKKDVLTAWRHIPIVDLGLVVKIDFKEMFGDYQGALLRFLIAGGFVIFLSLMVSILFSRYLISPLLSLKSTLEMIGKGLLPDSVQQSSRDEIGLMAGTVNNLVQTLRGNASFAQKIGEGDFDANFKPVSDDDLLGNALINMRHNLIETEKRDKERNWIVTGVAEISEILRMHDNLEELGDAVIQFIIEKIEAIQGAFYVLDDDDGSSTIVMKSCYAYNRKKYLKSKFKFAEGLVGQSVAEQDTIMRTEVPEDYVSITSGLLGEQKPSAILIVPLITNEEVYGVLEFAGFTRFSSSQVKFVEELSLILARTVFNIKINERTRMLLEESQTMSNELQEKQEVLRQNAEEMQATQEELQRSNDRLEEQIEEVNRTQKRMQLLLENASEVITIYEDDETIRYISPSVEPILGYSQEEMIGTKDVTNVHSDDTEGFENMFTKLIEGEQQLTIQYQYKSREGEYIWIEATGTNFLSDPAIHGIIVNSSDITERRRAEQEQRMRSKMQALSENSPDLITRLEQEGPISYINPVIETYTGKKPQSFLNRLMEESELNELIVKQWADILQQVSDSNQKISTEMDFPSEMGDRIMQVNAIPEFDEEEKLESVLVVSHDITERKVIELEIQNKNKKINDSINYAKRIQGAILPNTAIINKALPNSFILYKPKDVVSGDFPWYVQVDEDIYIAAVDCTGHGVPGALLSLIGYFLLNDIVRSRKISDPGTILDQLDEGVTQTLRQDQDDSKTKDGMDIALCKITVKTNTVEYAGAHRPLYVMKGDELVEIKGNKFAIGGGIYKNQTNFTTTKMDLAKDDSIYFCSDGFPDQFGGPDNRKFGPKRLRELIKNTHQSNMKSAYQAFDREWENWKGEYKQTDDVLLIGIKF